MKNGETFSWPKLFCWLQLTGDWPSLSYHVLFEHVRNEMWEWVRGRRNLMNSSRARLCFSLCAFLSLLPKFSYRRAAHTSLILKLLTKCSACDWIKMFSIATSRSAHLISLLLLFLFVFKRKVHPAKAFLLVFWLEKIVCGSCPFHSSTLLLYTLGARITARDVVEKYEYIFLSINKYPTQTPIRLYPSVSLAFEQIQSKKESSNEEKKSGVEIPHKK